MRMLALAGRTWKEITRDPITLMFGVGLPIALLALMTLIQNNVPVPIFAIDRLAPAIAVFSLSFISMFLGMLIARDRSTSFLARLFASPLRAQDFLLGYAAPFVPIALAQSALCLIVAILLGLKASPQLFCTLLALLPSALFYISLGLLLGTVLNDKAIGGVGSLLVNAATLLGGAWFDLSILSPGFRGFCYALPFAHCVDLARAATWGRYGEIPLHLCWVLGYAAVLLVVAVVLFHRKMKGGKG